MMATVCVLVHEPFAPVIVYTVLAGGVAVNVEPVLPPGFQV